jgi:hypothetical protein
VSRRILICTDLDGTLIPDGRAPESPSARERFARVVARSEVTLAYVTGRHQALVEEAIVGFSLPVPQIVIADVGATIYDIDQGSWRSWKLWESKLAEQWDTGTAKGLMLLPEEIAGLRAQEASKQAEFKVSFYLESGTDSREILANVRDRLARLETPARLIFSRDSMGIGLLDLLPPAAGKLSAIEFLMEQRGFRPEGTVFSGDSGNDLEVLASRLPSVLVANAGAEVQAQARETAAAIGHSEALYIARGGLLGMNANYAAGILEGLVHFLPETSEWLR